MWLICVLQGLAGWLMAVGSQLVHAHSLLTELGFAPQSVEERRGHSGRTRKVNSSKWNLISSLV